MTPYYSDEYVTLYHGRLEDVLPGLSGFHACVCDPPYGLSFMGRKWDYDVPSVEAWRAVYAALLTGAHLTAFAGTRTQHRMAVNIEDAGFEIRDMIAWVYGSGFPKSLDVSKAIDKAAGEERETVGKSVHFAKRSDKVETSAYGDFRNDTRDITDPATPAARQWNGWGTALKPALEPITLARKPLIGTVAANVLTHGTGALNIDAGRVPPTGESLCGGQSSTGRQRGKLHDGWQRPWMDDPAHVEASRDRAAKRVADAERLGRFPANLIHDGSEEVLAMFPESASTAGAIKRAGGFARGLESRTDRPAFIPDGEGYSDSGSAARFFYCAKASSGERGEGNTHPTVKPLKLMQYLIRLVCHADGITLDPFAGSGTTGLAARLLNMRAVLVEMDEHYCEIAARRISAVRI